MNENVWKKVPGFFADSFNQKASVERALKVINMCSTVVEEEPSDVFMVSGEGDEGPKDLWLFSEHYVMQAAEFLKQERESIRIIPIHNSIRGLTLKSEDFSIAGDYGNKESMLIVSFNTMAGDEVGLMAKGERECLKLLDTVKGRIAPNLKK